MYICVQLKSDDGIVMFGVCVRMYVCVCTPQLSSSSSSSLWWRCVCVSRLQRCAAFFFFSLLFLSSFLLIFDFFFVHANTQTEKSNSSAFFFFFSRRSLSESFTHSLTRIWSLKLNATTISPPSLSLSLSCSSSSNSSSFMSTLPSPCLFSLRPSPEILLPLSCRRYTSFFLFSLSGALADCVLIFPCFSFFFFFLIPNLVYI